MWFAGTPVIPVVNDVVEVWQVPHSPVSGGVLLYEAEGVTTTAGVPTKLLPVS